MRLVQHMLPLADTYFHCHYSVQPTHTLHNIHSCSDVSCTCLPYKWSESLGYHLLFLIVPDAQLQDYYIHM